MTKDEFVAQFPWVDPTLGYPDDTTRQGVIAHPGGLHIAVTTGAAHKSLEFIKPIHSADLEHVDGKDWEIFHVSHAGWIDNREYYWGMFLEGLGLFNVMVPVQFSRNLLDTERAAWAKKNLGMYGSHTGKFSYSLPSGVKP